jgi:hypothetical protein
MRRLFIYFILSFLVAALIVSSPVFATSRGIRVVSKKGQALYLYKDYYAVVIGVSEYEHWPRLPNAVKDAEEVAAKLKEMGFKVRVVTNPDSGQLKSTLADISRRLGREKKRALLLYFAGHGETTQLADGTDLGFIVPKDAPLQNLDPFGFDNKAVSMREIETVALKVKSKHVLMLFDSCFSGSLFALARAAPTEITEKSAKPVRQFMTAGSAKETVPDRSIFKVVLLQGLDGYADYNGDGYITGSELGMYLQSRVINYSRGAQHPQFGKINNPYLDKGDFIFVRKASGAGASKRVAAVVPSDDDETLIADEVERLRRERERLEAEKKFLEKEREKLAYVPKSVTKAKVSLRTEPRKISDSYLRTTLPKYGFYDASLYPQGGSFENHFVDNGDGTITDEATGLMWQKSGSPSTTSKSRAQAYLNKLNKNQLAGHWNWRLPTIDELASLLERDKINGVHINPVFDKEQKRCWSSDRADHVGHGQRTELWWLVDFLNGKGTIATISWYVPAKRFENNYVRAVRSIAVRPVE